MTTVAESARIEAMAAKLHKLVSAKKRIDENEIRVMTISFKGKERNEDAFIDQSVFGDLAQFKQVLSNDLMQRISSLRAEIAKALQD